MATKRTICVAALLALMATGVYGQGLNTTASPADWEEINFAFDSSVLTDGYPSLLRLADLLKANPGYRVHLQGHADMLGPNPYNQRLGLARANTVRDFLVKYGATASQISVASSGKQDPKAPGPSREARFMSRRVSMEVRDAQGNLVGAGGPGAGVGDAIRTLEEIAKKQQECCDEILKKLDKLDDILAMLRDLKDENDNLKQQVAGLRDSQAGLEKKVQDEVARVPTRSDMEQAVTRATEEVFEANRPKRFSLLGLNVGPDFTDGYRGNVSFSGKGRFFQPFNRHTALQTEGEYMYYRNRQEGQFDFGLVNRFGRAQVGSFASFKRVDLAEFQSGGTLGQGAFTLDMLFSRGRVGAFGTKSFLSEAVVHRSAITTTMFEETFLAVTDQVGFAGSVGLHGNAWLEGNAGAIFRRFGSNKPGFTARFVQPIGNSPVAFTIEGSLNETMVGSANNGRLVVGLQFGNWMRPQDFLASDAPVPVDIPRIRYELGTRIVRDGNLPPVADAGPDQLGVPPGSITLDGSASYDPEGDPITFSWQQISGPSVSISGMNTSVATFTAAQGTTYAFVLRVRDDKGAEGRARVTVSTRSPDTERIRVFRFQATPMTIRPGEASTLSWETENATSVEIDGIGPVSLNGATTVSPTETTTYRLVARSDAGEVTSTATVIVEPGNAPRVLRFAAFPTEIVPGESATLEWHVEDATSVTISGIGPVQVAGTTTVAPEATTTYTLTATSQRGTVTATTVITVFRQARIINFVANPSSIQQPGDPVQLSWETDGAEEVIITGIGTVPATGTLTVNPPGTTTYSLIARGTRESVTAVVTVQLVGPGGGPGGGPPVANAGPDFTTRSTTIRLDGTASFARIGGALRYSWRLIGAGEFRLARITPVDSATPTVELQSGIGRYTFELTVEDSEGARGVDTVTVEYRLPAAPSPAEPKPPV